MPRFLETSWQKRILSGLILAPVVLGIVYAGGAVFAIALAACALWAFYEWVSLSLRSPWKFALIPLGAVYIGFSFYCCYLIRMHAMDDVPALLFLALIWSSDIGAYVTGKTIGGPKLIPAVSPNKTWAGFAGAMVFPGVVFLFAFFLYVYFGNVGGVTPFIVLAVFAFGAFIGAVGQAGDLLVSKLKRHAHVKDTGILIPGHGGLLDRVDSLMLAAPVFLFLGAQMGMFGF